MSSLSIKDENNLSALSSDAAAAGEQDLPTCENPKLEKIRQECLRSVNPVGELIETAQRKTQRPPEFVFGDEQGPPHDRKFICVAKFENMEDIGRFLMLYYSYYFIFLWTNLNKIKQKRDLANRKKQLNDKQHLSCYSGSKQPKDLKTAKTEQLDRTISAKSMQRMAPVMATVAVRTDRRKE